MDSEVAGLTEDTTPDATDNVYAQDAAGNVDKRVPLSALTSITTTATTVNAAGAVMESDYDANTILKADADNTPEALTVAASRIVGRKATGDIEALTLAEVVALGGTPDGTKFVRDDGTLAAAGGSGASPAWYGKLYGALGGCNPNDVLQLMYNNPIHATPTNIAITVARCAYFRPPANITVNTIRFFGVGATTGVYHIAIYATPAGGARLTDDLSPNTAAQTWGTAATGLGLALTAGTLYLIAVSVDTTGTTAGMHCLSSTTGRIGVLPASWPGSLDIDAATPLIDPVAFCQFAVSTGVMPATLPTIVAQAAWTGGMPAIFLDNA
jgi:hypothetical protein